MHKNQKWVALSVSLTMIIIFILWLISLKYILNLARNADNLIPVFEKTFSEVKKSFEESIQAFQGSPGETPGKGEELTDEELIRLKEKVLEYQNLE